MKSLKAIFKEGFFGRALKAQAEHDKTQDLLDKLGAVTFCPKCHDILQSQRGNNCTEVSDGVYHFNCAECNNISEFNYILAPIPIVTCDDVAESRLLQEVDDYRYIVNKLLHIKEGESFIVIEDLQNRARKVLDNHDNHRTI